MAAGATAPGTADRRVVLGRLGGAFGVRGWVKLRSYTEPPEAILDYPVWRVQGPGGEQEMKLLEGRRHGSGVVARLEGVDDRDAAALLNGRDVAVRRGEMPAPPPGQYYWEDLIGLAVETLDGQALGTIEQIVDMPANPVMVVQGERERWLPLVPRHLKQVDLGARRVVVDWDADF